MKDHGRRLNFFLAEKYVVIVWKKREYVNAIEGGKEGPFFVRDPMQRGQSILARSRLRVQIFHKFNEQIN